MEDVDRTIDPLVIPGPHWWRGPLDKWCSWLAYKTGISPFAGVIGPRTYAAPIVKHIFLHER